MYLCIYKAFVCYLSFAIPIFILLSTLIFMLWQSWLYSDSPRAIPLTPKPKSDQKQTRTQPELNKNWSAHVVCSARSFQFCSFCFAFLWFVATCAEFLMKITSNRYAASCLFGLPPLLFPLPSPQPPLPRPFLHYATRRNSGSPRKGRQLIRAFLFIVSNPLVRACPG